MKKLIAFLLMIVMTISLTACGGNTEETAKDDTEGKKAVDILNDVWAAFKEEDKFAISGGDYENMVSDAPGAIGVSDGEALNTLLGFPADCAELIDDGASILHMMNQNTFTAGLYHVTNAGDVQTVADAVKENILNRHWMCGFPEELVIYSVGSSYVAVVFGIEQNVGNFEEALQSAYASASLLYEEALSF